MDTVYNTILDKYSDDYDGPCLKCNGYSFTIMCATGKRKNRFYCSGGCMMLFKDIDLKTKEYLVSKLIQELENNNDKNQILDLLVDKEIKLTENQRLLLIKICMKLKDKDLWNSERAKKLQKILLHR